MALPERRNPQHRNLFTVVSATSAPPFQPLRHERNVYPVSRPSCETLYATNTCNRKHNIFLYDYPLHWVVLPTKTYNRTLLFCSIHIKHGRHFNHWNQPLNMSMRVCYLDCQEAGLCCYLVIHKENLLRPLQLFYFHFWPILLTLPHNWCHCYQGFSSFPPSLALFALKMYNVAILSKWTADIYAGLTLACSWRLIFSDSKDVKWKISKP
jgi:hypothetical protein